MLKLRKPRHVIIAISSCLLISIIACSRKNNEPVNTQNITAAQKLFGLNFTRSERDSMVGNLKDNLKAFKKLQSLHLNDSVPPALVYNPIPAGKQFNHKQYTLHWAEPEHVTVPKDTSKLAFYSISQLAYLLRNRKITSTGLTKLYLNRLEKYGDTLHCVITITKDLALKEAKKADQEIAAGHYKGPLMGIPFGVKDLMAVKGYKTTWGAGPYKNQRINTTATVVKRLQDKGAVLIAKLTSGALAMGDVWYGGKTRNPWDLKQGSSGSSAGPASATSAGLVAFSLGTETWGSILAPSTRCGDTGLRPTFGRVSKYGVMALSWSMDKVGPICRDVQDCAIVFNAIHGPDGKDRSVVDLPFNFNVHEKLSNIRIGYLSDLFNKKDDPNYIHDEQTLATLKSLGANLIPITLPDFPVRPLSIILDAESAAAFQNLSLSNRDSLLVRQGKNAWPNLFREANFIPAVEYIQANRARTLLINKMDSVMKKIDVYVSPTFGGNNLLLTNLTGHPAVVVPNGFTKKKHPTSISFIGGLYKEGKALEVAKAFQDATNYYKKHPKMFMN
ncbi:MAG TPA: amidase [Balneolales bacterium]|nr:amidase [Balneolales bacterium]